MLHGEPEVKKYLRPFVGSEEFINGGPRWCLWLVDISPSELRSLPRLSGRVEAVRDIRLASTRETTRELAGRPTLFGEIRQPGHRYLAIPKTSFERRMYIPVGFLPSTTIASTELFTIEGANYYHLGILCSSMHMSWVRFVAGRLKSDYRYSSQIVYNNFPWPSDPTEEQKAAIEEAAQGVLDARDAHPEASLADLYDPIATPTDLRKAHQALDKAVDAAYGKKTFTSDAERVAFLFELYHKYTSLLPGPEKLKKKRKAKKAEG